MPAKPSLAEKLRTLGFRPAAEIIPETRTASDGVPIQGVVPGRFVQTRAGDAYCCEQVYPAKYLHGSVSIQVLPPFTTLAAWAHEPRFLSLPLEAYAFLDTETSGLAGGTGTYAFLVGAARFIDGDFHLAQFFMRDPAEEAALLEGLADFLAPCQALVTFNGKAFDVPLLHTRYTLHAIPVPFKGYAHLDLLALARRLWRDRLPSRALKYLEEHVLMAPRTQEEVPGYEIPYLYFDYLRTGDAQPLRGVFYHNAMDVVAMAALLNHISSILEDPEGELVEHGLDMVAIARLYEDLGKWDAAARLFERGLERELPEEDFWQTIRRLSQLQKRRGDLDTAVRLWEQAAGRGHVYAHIELAKYHEHQRHDYDAAMAWTESAINLVKKEHMPRFMFDHWMDELSHRQERLQQRKKHMGWDGKHTARADQSAGKTKRNIKEK